MVKPHLKTNTMPYAPPDFPAQLEWWDVFRGPRQAGELLGAFELLQVRTATMCAASTLYYVFCWVFFVFFLRGWRGLGGFLLLGEGGGEGAGCFGLLRRLGSGKGR